MLETLKRLAFWLKVCLNSQKMPTFRRSLNVIISVFRKSKMLGPDYMANFSPGRNFSPANRAEISSRLLKQILLKSNCRLHGEGFSPGRNSARAKILARFFKPG